LPIVLMHGDGPRRSVGLLCDGPGLLSKGP
jgi:hypothetical protein